MRPANIVQVLIFSFILFVYSGCEGTSNDELLKENITWSEHIAPLIFKNCTPCHRPGEAGGFNLLNHNDAVKRANQIKFVTRTRYMPPWPADPGYSHFIGERVLSEEEINTIANWVDNGLQRGDSLKEPAKPVFYSGSYFGKPDMIIKAQHPIKIKGNGTDAFMIIKYPYRMEKDTVVDFVEFVPHHRKIIHHVNGHLVSYDADRKFDYLYGTSVHTDIRSEIMDVYKKMQVPYTDSKEPRFPTLTPNTIYYLPGFIPPSYPAEIGGYKMKKNGLFLLNNIHFGPSNADVEDTSYINVFFRKTPVKRPIFEAQLGTFSRLC